jgi:glutamate/tyrosine decarboxylase-like PLP-dependent enzyme
MEKTDKDKFESLDPEDWEAMRKLAHQMVDDSIDYLATVAERPVWQNVPDEIDKSFNASVPTEPQDPEAVYREFTETIFPYPMGNIHPRFWAWYMGNGTMMGALGDFMAAVMNPNIGGGNNAPIKVEGQVVNWIKEITGMPESCSGLLVSGGSMANLVGLAVARNVGAGFDIRKQGLQFSDTRMCVYGSVELHSSNQKAVELMGLGSDSLRKVSVNPDFTMDCDALRRAIEDDISAGMKPVCVVASAGTVNTGAIDNLISVADICQEFGVWFHVDGAIGAVAMLSDKVRPQLAGIERADSLALDLHKWLHIPFDAGCVLVRDEKAHRDTFSLIPEYLQKATRGIAAGDWFSEYGVQLSRSFRALKVWMTIKEHGTRKLGRMISRNVEQAHYLAKRVEQESRLELMAPVGMDIVCFRYNPGNTDLQKLNDLNRDIVIELQEQGIAAPSSTTLRGPNQYGIGCIRVAIANHRSRFEDFDVLVRETIRIAEEIVTDLEA